MVAIFSEDTNVYNIIPIMFKKIDILTHYYMNAPQQTNNGCSACMTWCVNSCVWGCVLFIVFACLIYFTVGQYLIELMLFVVLVPDLILSYEKNDKTLNLGPCSFCD